MNARWVPVLTPTSNGERTAETEYGVDAVNS
jgi:hypothetical protein